MPDCRVLVTVDLNRRLNNFQVRFNNGNMWASCTAAFSALVLLPAVQAAVELVPIPHAPEFAEATEPGAIQYACGDDAELASYLIGRGLVFDTTLRRSRPGYPTCHIYYEPTLPGFRAATEDRPIRELFAAAHPGSFNLALDASGDSLSVVKRVLPLLPKPLTVGLRLNEYYDPSYWAPGLQLHFPNTQHKIEIHPTPGIDTHPWPQDYIKSGSVNGELKILVPRRIFEGRQDDGEIHRPMLDGLRGERFVRSKLSWEGGDLIFVKHPQEPEKHILVYGGAAREYWGAELPAEDYEWVLKTEFGADVAVGLPEASAHIDYIFSFLPDEPVVFVSRAVRESLPVVGALIQQLSKLWGDSAPKGLLPLRSEVALLLQSGDGDEESVREWIDSIRKQTMGLRPAMDPDLVQDLTAWVAENCPAEPPDCLESVEGKRHMLAKDHDLARRMANHGMKDKVWAELAPRLLDMLEGQLPQAPTWHAARVDRKAQELRKMGFRIIRTPILLADDKGTTWPAAGYTNMLTVGRKLFIPTFELGVAEDRLLADVQKKLGNDYEIVQVPAQMSLLNNGGVHCVFGIVREP